MCNVPTDGLGAATTKGFDTNYQKFFTKLSGFYPFPYQESLYEALRAGESVVLRVPTGAGKTWAVVAPFLHSLTENKQPLADRLLYALPLRSLATSLHATVFSGMSEVFERVAAVGNSREYLSGCRYCSLQIGGQKDDAFFESDLVFTTIDQLLSSYLLLPVSLPDRVGNINAGALIGSIIVFDELHLLDSSVALGTVVEMLDRLRNLCQFVLMTATTSDATVNWLSKHLGAMVLPVPDEEIRKLPSQSAKHRTWKWSAGTINAQTVAAAHSGGRTIALVNTVRRAQELFVSLEAVYKGLAGAPKLLLLHSRFYPEDRRRVEEQLEPFFGPAATDTNVILVTTQVIEAGMDLSAEQLHSELAPMNALIQRAGRTARYLSRPAGQMVVYEAMGDAPYADDAALLEGTRKLLQNLPTDGGVVDFVEERRWIEAVHAAPEERDLARYDSLTARRNAVHRAMDEGDRGLLSDLVRDIDSINVLIASDPEAQFEGPAWPRLLSVPRMSLMTLAKCFKNLKPGQWVAKGAREDDSNERPGLRLKWEELTEKQLRGQWLVAVHPSFASYSQKIGLRLAEGGPEPSVVMTASAQWQRYSYQFEAWVEHARRVVARAREMEPAYWHSTRLLATHFGVAEDVVRTLLDFVCVCHDVGKLAEDWQTVAWKWQDDKDLRARTAGRAVPVRPGVPIAHTWYEPELDWKFKGKYPFPPHAVQGAFAVCEAAAASCAGGGKLWRDLASASAVSAVARHHGARTRECTIFRLPVSSAQLVRATGIDGVDNLQLDGCGDRLARDQFPEALLSFGREMDSPAWPLYAFLVRRLRLADQAATGDIG